MINKFNNFWFSNVNSIRLEFFRLAIGVSLFLYMVFRFQNGAEWLTNQGFHLSVDSVPYHNSWMPVLPEFLLIPFAHQSLTLSNAFIYWN